MARDNFPANIKVRLAQRAGYLCSICNTLTIGPSNESDSAINLTGVASHITAASSGFRRYDGNLTTADRMSIENGIWLCNTHGDLIDGDDVTYTTAYLKFLKNNHEENIKLKQSGIKTEKGILTKIEASNFGLFSETVKLDFSNLNIIFGNNGLGKTLILDLISSIHYKSKLNRWINSRRGKVNSFFNAYYFKNQLDKLSIHVDNNDSISYMYNDNLIPLLAPPIKILYISKSYSDFIRKASKKNQLTNSVVSLIAKYFKLTNEELINIILVMMRDKKYFFNDISFDESRSGLNVKMSSSSPTLSFNQLSGGERERVLLEISLKIAIYYSKFNSTFFLIENTSFDSIDSFGINKLFEIVREGNYSFQFFFTTIPNDKYNTNGFKINNLVQTSKNIVVK